MPRKNQVGNTLNSLRKPGSERNKQDKKGEKGGAAENVKKVNKSQKETRPYEK